MSSFFSSSSYKPQAQIRQEGFHPPQDSSSTPPPPHNFDLFNPFLPDPFRKFPAGPSTSMDFSDELASLIQGPPSHDRSHSDDRYHHRPPHNIFDISAPTPAPNNADPQSYPPHFNQTLPALNSSLRYENDSQTQNPPPSSFHHFTRHTPSPISGSHPNPSGHSRSRSRSRPPSSGGATANPGTAGGIGPARTTRTRRNNSVSSTSPPPGRPHAIVIPRSRAATVGGNANGNGAAGWFMPGHSTLPASTPSTQQQAQNQYSPFSLSPPPETHTPNGLHLPPVSALHNMHHPHQAHQPYLHGHGHGLSNSPHSLPNIHTNLAIPTIPTLPTERPSAASGGAGNSGSTGGSGANGASDKQTLLANEKRRRRRESHNAVERRRRDNINEKISELATLIPECLLDVGGTPTGNASGNPASPTISNPQPHVGTPTDDPSSPLDWKKDPSGGDANSNSGGGTPEAPGTVAANAAATAEGLGIVKANKGMILRKSVEYIRYLQQLVEAQGARNRELESELKEWRAGGNPGAGGEEEGAGGGGGGGGGGEMGMGMGMGGMMGGIGAYGGGAGYGGGGSNFFGLPSMPEGEGEEEEGRRREEEEEVEGDVMDVEEGEEEASQGRGRTRGVNGVGKTSPGKGRKKGGAAVKEEGAPAEEMMVL
ncbi:HLH-domain-containing protein [Lyophyllum atratum]|nr:HLH-domain-containing protein [Lyophyllum atratum]